MRSGDYTDIEHAAKLLSRVCRATINKGEKLELLYRYLSGVDFRQRVVEAIVEAFERMREDLLPSITRLELPAAEPELASLV